jgi:hypothetical protein
MNDTVKYLRKPETIRERCHHILECGINGTLSHFHVHMDKLEEVSAYVVKVTTSNYPDLNVPYHSRWTHFNSPARNRLGEFRNQITNLTSDEQGKALYDLVITSVLLDAGAGMKWQYKVDGEVLSKSEGLAVASYEMFCSGLFSNSSEDKFRADGEKLKSITADQLAEAFQVSTDNTIVGLDGRTSLLNKLGEALCADKTHFGEDGRLGNLYSFIANKESDGNLKAKIILETILESLGSIWPGRIVIDGENMGDVWNHSSLNSFEIGKGLVPFHKLSQWLSYSLVEPLEWNGIQVNDLDDLTGLPEYRNGGLFVDMNLLVPKEQSTFDESHKPDSEVIVEWRALTLALLDKVGEQVRSQLNKTQEEFPLAKVLQGGTWAAGRILAKERRTDGGPPISLNSDGTVF